MASPLSGKRLLLVAEDAELAKLVAAAVAQLGAEVAAVRSGRAALEALARRRPDVAVLDLPLADVRGSEVLSALARAEVPAIAVSAVYRGPRAEAEVRRLGARELFEKPFAVGALAQAVARAVGVRAGDEAEEEARDEVTGAIPLRVDETGEPIASAPLPALEDGPIAGGRARREGLAAPLPESLPARPPTADLIPQARGELAHSGVARLLVALHESQATGALTVTRGPIRKIVVVEGGAVVYAASNVAAERFGAVCVRRGVVSQERLDELRRDAAPSARTAELLAAAGLLTAQVRSELVARQARAVVWSTFEWREGSYVFQLGRPPAARVPLRLAAGDLVLEGTLRTATLPRLRAELPDDVHLAPSPAPAVELYALGLRPKEAHLLTLADGTKSVADLVRLSDLPERDALAFLDACRVMRVLDEVERVLASTRRIGFM